MMPYHDKPFVVISTIAQLRHVTASYTFTLGKEGTITYKCTTSPPSNINTLKRYATWRLLYLFSLIWHRNQFQGPRIQLSPSHLKWINHKRTWGVSSFYVLRWMRDSHSYATLVPLSPSLSPYLQCRHSLLRLLVLACPKRRKHKPKTTTMHTKQKHNQDERKARQGKAGRDRKPTDLHDVGGEVELHVHRLGSVLEAKEGARLVEEVVVHLAPQARPWVLSLPNEHSRVASPHPRVPAFDQSPILYVICELGLHTKTRGGRHPNQSLSTYVVL